MKPLATSLGGLLILAATPLVAEQPTLFERAGGRETLTAIADDFVDTIVMDAAMHENPHVAEMSEVAPLDYMKVQIAMYFCEHSGGPCTHHSRPMGKAFAPMRFRTQDWQRSRALFARAITAHGVREPEAGELLEIFDTLRQHFLPDKRAAK